MLATPITILLNQEQSYILYTTVMQEQFSNNVQVHYFLSNYGSHIRLTENVSLTESANFNTNIVWVFVCWFVWEISTASLLAILSNVSKEYAYYACGGLFMKYNGLAQWVSDLLSVIINFPISIETFLNR